MLCTCVEGSHDVEDVISTGLLEESGFSTVREQGTLEYVQRVVRVDYTERDRVSSCETKPEDTSEPETESRTHRGEHNGTSIITRQNKSERAAMGQTVSGQTVTFAPEIVDVVGVPPDQLVQTHSEQNFSESESGRESRISRRSRQTSRSAGSRSYQSFSSWRTFAKVVRESEQSRAFAESERFGSQDFAFTTSSVASSVLLGPQRQKLMKNMTNNYSVTSVDWESRSTSSDNECAKRRDRLCGAFDDVSRQVARRHVFGGEDLFKHPDEEAPGNLRYIRRRVTNLWRSKRKFWFVVVPGDARRLTQLCWGKGQEQVLGEADSYEGRVLLADIEYVTTTQLNDARASTTSLSISNPAEGAQEFRVVCRCSVLKLFAPTRESMKCWLVALNDLASEARRKCNLRIRRPLQDPDAMPSAAKKNISLNTRRLWSSFGVQDHGAMSTEKLGQILQSLNISARADHAADLLAVFDLDQNGELDMEQFSNLLQTFAIKESLVTVFQKYSEEEGLPPESWAEDQQEENVPPGQMSKEQFARFLLLEQCEEGFFSSHRGIQGTGELFDRLNEPYVVKRKGKKYITEAGFSKLMTCAENSIFDPKHRAKAYQDMTQPLSQYWIASSHNTYLEDDQLVGESSLNQYVEVLMRSCRCVEIDCWDGEDGEPKVTHGYTATSQLRFFDVICACNDYGFQQSNYPLILSLEVHCCERQRVRMAQILHEVLGDKLLQQEFDSDLTSPHAAKGKVIVKAKVKLRNVTGSTEELQEDQPPWWRSLSTGLSPLFAAAPALRSSLSGSSLGKDESDWLEQNSRPVTPRPVEEVDEEDEEAGEPEYRTSVGSVGARQTEYSPLAKAQLTNSASIEEQDHFLRVQTETSSKWSVLSSTVSRSVSIGGGLFPWAKTGTTKSTPGITVHKSTSYQPASSEALSEEQASGAVARFSSDESRAGSLVRTLTTEITNRSSIGSSRSRATSTDWQWEGSLEERTSMPSQKAPKTLPVGKADGQTLLQASGQAFLLAGCVSHAETKAMKFVSKHGEEKVRCHHTSFLSRVYPNAARISSGNYNPMPMWLAGFQMVALNYQRNDMPMVINNGLFMNENGGVGYVLKPPRVLGEASSMACTLQVRVLSGHWLPKPMHKGPHYVNNPKVRVRIEGMPEDQAAFETKVVADNGFNPFWDDLFVFKLMQSDVAILAFEVVSIKGMNTDIVGAAAFPVSGLREGFRWVPLLDWRYNVIELAGLLVEVRMEGPGKDLRRSKKANTDMGMTPETAKDICYGPGGLLKTQGGFVDEQEQLPSLGTSSLNCSLASGTDGELCDEYHNESGRTVPSDTESAQSRLNHGFTATNVAVAQWL